jgi:hypothetical protein
MILAASMNNGWQLPGFKMTKEIEFICTDENVLKHFPIVPAKDCLPEWYKQLHAKDDNGVPTIAGCMPVRDIVTSGYIVTNAFEQEIIGNTFDLDDVEQIEKVYPVEEIGKFFEIQNHMTHPGSGHSHSQCPIELEGKKKSYFKISLPWRIKTPPGYSCLFMQPYYHFEKEFALLPAIIDTDVCDLNSVHFPGYLKDPVAQLKVGQPLMQVIPIKREEWKSISRYEKPSRASKLNLYLHNMYKRAFHQKKRYQ